MKLLLCLVLITLALQNVDSAMTENQLKAALKMVRNVCQPKFKATNEQIESLHYPAGKWDGAEKSTQCYLWCILNMYKLITAENKFDLETGLTVMNVQAPESLRKTAVPSLTNCKDSVKTPSDKCIAGYEIARCIYDSDPEHYFLP